MKRLKVAIIGSGNIGTDLLIKILRSPVLECTLFAGRHENSPGMLRARSLGARTSARSIHAIEDEAGICQLVFDATSAMDHARHWPVLDSLGKIVIDMTPSRVGEMIVPAVNLDDCIKYRNVNMVSCGGQASTPIASVIGTVLGKIEYVEVVSSIASRSAGAATRKNLDEYIDTTEEALKKFSGCRTAKTILILNPADPCVNMQTTISAKIDSADTDTLAPLFWNMVNRIQAYVPGYQVVVPPVFETNRIVTIVRVRGRGDFLPSFAGNLDIINCAAIVTAERYARHICGEEEA